MGDEQEAVLQRIDGAERILIFGHVSPDGDALGSALGLTWLIRAQGKAAEVSFEDPVPPAFTFLPGADGVADRAYHTHDLIIAVDGSDATRYGDCFSAAYTTPTRPPVVVIDHHKTNTHFGDINWIDSRYTATAEMIYHLAEYAGWEISPAAATCLATGCVTDTNTFSTDHTTPEVLEVVADLMRAGAPLATIVRRALHLRSATDALLWGRVLSTLRIEGHVAWAISRAADRAAVGATKEEGGGLSTFLRNIIGVYIGILFTEVDAETIRVSIRAEPEYDVGILAFELGGGGHAAAAGVTLNMGIEEAVDLVVARAQALIASTGGGGPQEPIAGSAARSVEPIR